MTLEVSNYVKLRYLSTKFYASWVKFYASRVKFYASRVKFYKPVG